LQNVIFGMNFDRTKGDNPAIDHETDVLPIQGALEPGSKLLPSLGDRKSFHKSILKSLIANVNRASLCLGPINEQ
jgi:hypothetical protein